jgi:hypothetical protein
LELDLDQILIVIQVPTELLWRQVADCYEWEFFSMSYT